MTDLERVRKALALLEGIAVPDWDTAREMATARADIDAHLKEDAEAWRGAMEYRKQLQAQRDTLLAELRELRDKAINRLTEDSPMLLIDVRDIDAILSEVEGEK